MLSALIPSTTPAPFPNDMTEVSNIMSALLYMSKSSRSLCVEDSTVDTTGNEVAEVAMVAGKK
jgi:hypothetical protein